MAGKKQLFEQYGREAEGVVVMVCPDCKEPELTFETLEAWKDHMQRQHGGYTTSEVAAGQPERPEKADGGANQPAPAAPTLVKPKRLSAKARELNDKLNRCISLVLKHMLSGINEEERLQLEAARTEITEAFIGIEFDFEERLISLNGKWAVLVVLVLLYTLPSLPTMKEAIAKASAKAKEKAEAKKGGTH
jgi:hypothetical protein